MKHAAMLGAAMVWLVACDAGAPTSSTRQELPELAATSLWMPLEGTFPNECPPVEDVAFSGKAHFLIRGSSGQSRLSINWADVKGVGLVTGDRYVVQDNFKSELILSGNGTEEIREHLRMIRLGSADNLYAVVHLVFDLTTGDVEVVEFTVECRG